MDRYKTMALVAAAFAAGMMYAAGCGEGRAQAATAETCSRWEFADFDAYGLDCSTEQPCNLPAGWEPFANTSNYGYDLWIRRCAD